MRALIALFGVSLLHFWQFLCYRRDLLLQKHMGSSLPDSKISHAKEVGARACMLPKVAVCFL